MAAAEQISCVVGVDLGSTTSKAVVLDLQGNILGRGITNSRSSYDRAVEVAQTEAFIAARFGLLKREVEKRAGAESLTRLLAAFRLEQMFYQLRQLDEAIGKEIETGIAAVLQPAVKDALATIMKRINDEELQRFADQVKDDRSDFFRDAAGSAYTRIAEELCADSAMLPGVKLSFDLLLGLYDKTIIGVENAPLELGFVEHIDGALERLGRPEDLSRGVESATNAVFDKQTTVGTGYGRARLPFPKEQIRSEILCHGLGAHAMFPGTRTVLDIGGQDTKAIQVDEHGVVTSFQMNDRCAAGCGRYLGYIADELSLGLHELGPLAMQARKVVRVNSTCTVFAGAELRERLALGQSREDVLAGLHRAIILRAMSLLARSGGIVNEFTFTGGVCKNPMATQILREMVTEHYGELTMNAHADSIYMGALGAALFAMDDVRRGVPQLLPHVGAVAPSPFMEASCT